MQSVCEFRLKYAKTTQFGHFGHTCTGTPLTCTGTGCILLGCTGTAWTYTGTVWLLLGLYQYNPVPVPVQLQKFCPKLLFLPTFGTNSPHTTSLTHNTSRIIMEIIQNNFTTLELVIWNSYYKTLGENLMNSTKGPPILYKTI